MRTPSVLGVFVRERARYSFHLLFISETTALTISACQLSKLGINDLPRE